ncbi:hypothetical protein Flavo103_36930 [Flavobacterium collinsii]|nr:hypothetical protein Flavo103_36930 [Flavobacterium collinsii]
MRNNFNSRCVSPLFISLLFLFSCKGQSDPDCLVKLRERISPHVNEENKIGEVINLKEDVNCFEWDSLVIIMAIYLSDRSEKELGIKLPKDDNYIWEPDTSAMLLFVKDKKVVYSTLQRSTVSREVFDSAKSLKAYYFLKLLNNYGNGSYYVVIPKEKAIFETYAMVYSDENGNKVSHPEYGLGIKVKELGKKNEK